MAVWEPVFKMWPIRPQPSETSGWMYTVEDQYHELRTIGYCMSWEDRVKRTQADIVILSGLNFVELLMVPPLPANCWPLPLRPADTCVPPLILEP